MPAHQLPLLVVQPALTLGQDLIALDSLHCSPDYLKIGDSNLKCANEQLPL